MVLVLRLTGYCGNKEEKKCRIILRVEIFLQDVREVLDDGMSKPEVRQILVVVSATQVSLVLEAAMVGDDTPRLRARRSGGRSWRKPNANKCHQVRLAHTLHWPCCSRRSSPFRNPSIPRIPWIRPAPTACSWRKGSGSASSRKLRLLLRKLSLPPSLPSSRTEEGIKIKKSIVPGWDFDVGLDSLRRHRATLPRGKKNLKKQTKKTRGFFLVIFFGRYFFSLWQFSA